MAAIEEKNNMTFGQAIQTCLRKYADFTGRTILQPQSLLGAKISVRSQTALTKKEAVWLLDALFWLAGVRMVPEGEKFVFAVPSSRVGELPKFKPQIAS
jgi:hypothetical protein